MSSFFTLELDTTAPQVEIILPPYTTTYTKTTIRVVANEELADIQRIVAIDTKGERHQLNFLYQETEYTGTFTFSDYPLGTLTIEATVWDTVLNQSAIVQKTIQLLDTKKIEVEGTHQLYSPLTSEVRIMSTEVQELPYIIESVQQKREITSEGGIRKVDVRTEVIEA